MKHRANGPEQKSRRRQRPPESPRLKCAFTQVLMATSEPKIVINDVGAEVVVAEDVFFRRFVYPVIMTKRLKQDKKKAARLIPGLAEYKGTRGVRWRLSFRQFARKAPRQVLEHLLDQLPEDSPLHLRICSADERARFSNAS